MGTRFKIAVFLLLFFSLSSFAQLRLNNLVEYQIGNIPGEKPGNQSSLYDQLNLKYKYKNVGLFTRVEQFYPSYDQEKSYTKLNQYRVEYSSKSLKIEAGNFYTALGRGLLLRSYEIPSSVYEDRGYRIRYGFYKDLSGISVKYKSKHFGVKFIRGKSLHVELPPATVDIERRTDLIEAGELEYRVKNQGFGMILMRDNNVNASNLYHSLFYSGSIQNITIYGELAQRADSLENVFNFSSSEAYGGYLGVNYTAEKAGLALEYKNYRNFLIGDGSNDPPSLVREQPYRLLNRVTHVPLIHDEWGYQAEFFYLFNNNSILTLNHALASNMLAGKIYNFEEFFAEYSFGYLSGQPAKWFADYSRDPLMRQPTRITTGGAFDIGHGRFTSSFDVETQYIASTSGSEEVNFFNHLISYTLSESGKVGITALLETTKDPSFLNGDSKINLFPSVSLAYEIDRHNKLLVFVGKRRGGPSCTSGVCYDVLDFQGVEIRLTTRL